MSRTDTEFVNGVRDGSVAAGVSGVWNAVAIEEVWGENMGAAKLPTYTCAGRQVQMASFSGCKLIGVNAYSEYPEWAARFAEWVTSEENQKLRFAGRVRQIQWSPRLRKFSSLPQLPRLLSSQSLLSSSG